MKRLEIIKYLIGTWKPTPRKYTNMTEQIRYVSRKLELLNEAKIVYFQQRAVILKKEVEELRHSAYLDPKNKLLTREKQLGHDHELIDKLYKQTSHLKQVAD